MKENFKPSISKYIDPALIQRLILQSKPSWSVQSETETM